MRTAKPEIVTPEQWRAARGRCSSKAHPRARPPCGRAPPHADDPCGEGLLRSPRPGAATRTLLDLFDGSRQLVVYCSFMDLDMDVYRQR